MKHIIRSLALVTVLLSSCQIETKRNQQAPPKTVDQTLVDPKYSISQDRAELDKLRESVPEKTRKMNDEKALLAEWMYEFRSEPFEIREKYDNLARKKRESFNSDLDQRKNFEDYLKEHQLNFSSELKIYNQRWSEKKNK